MARPAVHTARRVAIVGAGIGGLTAAIALSQDGHDVVVYEQARELGEVGAGIQLSPNATRVLASLGLLDDIEARSVEPASGDLHRWDDGSILVSQPLGAAVRERFGNPYLHVHRADLHGVLADAARRCCTVETDRRVIDLAGGAERVRPIPEEGSPLPDADLVIGADGIHSNVRRVLFGEESPRFSGSSAWRGIVRADSVAHLQLRVASHAFLGPGRHFVTYYVRGGELVNWVGVAPSADWTLESWTTPGERDDVLADFDGWCETVVGLIHATEGTPFRWALYDRDPLAVWGDGCVSLLGDACHPMLPFMAQGAAQAIEDAAVLTWCLRGADDTPTALRSYEDLRRDRTARVQLAARANETMFHLPDGPEQRGRDARLAAPSSQGEHRNAWLFDYDALAPTPDESS